MCLTLCDPEDCCPPGSCDHGGSPGKNSGMGCTTLLQGIFSTLGWNPGLLQQSEPLRKPNVLYICIYIYIYIYIYTLGLIWKSLEISRYHPSLPFIPLEQFSLAMEYVCNFTDAWWLLTVYKENLSTFYTVSHTNFYYINT